jgi:hypothetical protein
MEEEKSSKGWSIELGLYPGILLGVREYQEETFTTWVIYFPFVDIAIIVEK